MNSQHLYRVQIVAYPKGALITDEMDPEWADPDPSWQPEGWDPSEAWIEICGRGSRDFFWPSTYREYRSRSSAVRRKKLIESFGATCIVQRSARIEWPADFEEKVS